MSIAEILVATGIVLTLGGFSWKMVFDSNREGDERIKRVYQRFDEYKQHLELSHVRKEVCDILHKQTSADISEIKADVKEILKEMRNGRKG